jgi:tRNA pseudouridine55 synthase
MTNLTAETSVAPPGADGHARPQRGTPHPGRPPQITSAAQLLHGLLAVNKPAGMISKDVSRWLQKRCGRLKIGHVGTLDPGASGVLPILLGKATRLQDYLLDMPKSYEFDMRLGSETDTLDMDGQVVREAPWEHVTAEALTAAIQTMHGDIEQTPPIYSAVKYKGKPLYDYARGDRGAEVPLETMKRRVHIASFEMLGFHEDFGTFRVHCSRGTYVRTLVKDLADKVGSCGTLTRLVRTHAAGVELGVAHDLDTIEARLDDFASLMIPLDRIELGVPRWRAAERAVTARLQGGQQVAVSPAEYVEGLQPPQGPLPGAWARPLLLVGDDGEAFGIGSVRGHESGRMIISMKRGL